MLVHRRGDAFGWPVHIVAVELAGNVLRHSARVAVDCRPESHSAHSFHEQRRKLSISELQAPFIHLSYFSQIYEKFVCIILLKLVTFQIDL